MSQVRTLSPAQMKLFKKILVISILFVVAFSGYSQNKDVITATVEFVVNTNDFVRNRDYECFINELVPYIKDNARDIESIILIGSASPEGSIQHNTHLAKIRSEKIYSYIKEYVPKSKIVVNNNYDLFLSKTGFDECNYDRLRATYIELHFRKLIPEKETVIDTVYVDRRDTIYKETINNFNYYIPIEHTNGKPVLSVYNDLLSDLLFRVNIGAEVYFNKMSFFVEGSFSNWKIVGKTYNIDFWHIGLRKYFNNEYDRLFIEINANAGYFDTDLFGSGKFGVLYGGGVGCGYVFSLKHHWKIYPIIRFGLFERVYYSDYKADGNINISFGNYTNWRTNGTGDTTTNNGVTGEPVNKVINNDFFEKSNKAYYIGPTYVGIVLKKDFCVNKKNKKKKD